MHPPDRSVERIAAREPRRPEDTALHRIVREHLESFVDHARLTYEKPLPRYVIEEFDRYLRCGIPAHGFVLLRCPACGDQSIVAFSCCPQLETMKSSPPDLPCWRDPPRDSLRIVFCRRARR